MKKLFKLFLSLLLVFILFNAKNVKATEYEENLIKKIAPDGQNATLKTVKPTSDEESDMLLTSMLVKMLNEQNYSAGASCQAPDFTNCTISIWDNRVVGNEGFSKEYNVTIYYDLPQINPIIDDYKNKIKVFNQNDRSTLYQVEDLGLINYYMTSAKSELWNPNAGGRALKYSSDIIKMTNGSNVSFTLDLRAGEQEPEAMFEYAFGGMNIYYNGYCYGTVTQGVNLRRVIYISQNTENTTAAYIYAAKQRIDEYLGDNNGITISYGGPLSSSGEANNDPTVNLEATDGNYYNITIKEKTYRFYIIKGNEEQLVFPEYLGSEIATNISVTSRVSTIPLDTALIVNSVSSNSIEEVLGNEDYKAFDIKLYSDGKDTYIEKLENGKFLVKIPVPIEYEGKELVVYYINSKNEVEKHSVTIENGNAIFETNHFSTYILTQLSNAESIENPNTSDNILFYVVFGIISIVGLTGCVLFLAKKRLKK